MLPGRKTTSTMISGREADLAARLREAAANGQTKVVLELLEEGAPFIVDGEGQTALHQAASAGHPDTVAALLLGGCDVSVQDFSGHTALQRAASEGHVEIVKQLIKHGGSVDHQDEVHGNTALHEAAWKGFSQTVGVLCRSKANFYIKNRGGFAPLHLCCQNGHNETCRVLLLQGCKPDLKNNYGDTPLHTSARYGHAGVIRILVSARSNASEQNKNGDTALHIAAAMGRRKLTRILIESGCDINAKNKQGETALDISRRKNLTEIVQILQNPPPVLSQADRETEADRARDRERSQSTGQTSGHSSGGHAAAGQPTTSGHSSSHPHNVSSSSGQTLVKGEKKREKGSSSSKENDQDRQNKRDKKKSRSHKYNKDDLSWSPYGCHYQPDMEEFPLPRIDTIPDDPLKAGEQYFLDLAGNIKKGPTGKSSYACYCGPAFQKFERKLERDKRELMKHIDSSHSRLDTKISHLEKKTKDQIFNLNQTMKESFALERSECMDRMDRRALRERIAIERQQAVRDISLKRDLASWLEKKLREIETKHGGGADAKNSALLRSLALRAYKQGKRSSSAVLSDVEGGSLRRAVSEELLSDVGVSEKGGGGGSGRDESSASVYKGLKVSDRPTSVNRVRRNSAGDESEIFANAVGGSSLTLGGALVSSSNATTAAMAGLTGDNTGFQKNYSHDILTYSTNSESYQDTSHSDRGSITSRESRGKPTAELLLPPPSSSSARGKQQQQLDPGSVPSVDSAAVQGQSSLSDLSQLQIKGSSIGPSGGGKVVNGLLRPIPMCYPDGESSSPSLPNPGYPDAHPTTTTTASYHPSGFKTQMNPIRRFSTEVDIHHATPLLLEPEPEPYADEFQQSYLIPEPAGGSSSAGPGSLLLPPAYRSPPPSLQPPPHLYHPRDRLPRSGPLLPPVDEDDYVPAADEDKDQDLHRQLLNLPLHSDGGSHDSHNDSGYSTRFGASAGPSPSLSGSRAGSTDGDGTQVRTQELGLPVQPLPHHTQQYGGTAASQQYGGVPNQQYPYTSTNQMYNSSSVLHYPQGGLGHHQQQPTVGLHQQPPGVLPAGGGLPTAPRIRALQNKLKLAEVGDAEGSLV